MFYFSVLLFLAYLIRLWISSFYGLHPDEAYYWSWSQNLSLGYYDHPPLLAWCLRLGHWFVNLLSTEQSRNANPLFFAQMGLRVVPYFLSCVVTPLAIGQSIENVQKHPLRVSQMFVLLTSPAFLLAPFVITPDAPFFAGWAMALFFAIKFQRSRASDSLPGDPTPFQLSRAIRIGVVLAFCAYARSSSLLPAFLFVITGAGLYNSLVAGVTALILFIPHLYWAYTVGLPMETGLWFQLRNNISDSLDTLHVSRVGDLFAAQIFLWTPFVFIATFLLPLVNFRKLFVTQKDSQLLGTLFVWAVAPLAFYALISLKHPVHENLPLMGLVPALVLVLSRYKHSAFWLYTMLFVNFSTLFLGLLLVTHNAAIADAIRGYSPRLAARLEQPSRLNEFQNWDKLHEIIFAATKSKNYPVAVQSYQILSELLFEDSVSKGDKRFGPDRLKIWSQGSAVSQYNFQKEYALEQNAKPFWLVTRNTDVQAPNCLLYQTLSKNPAEVLQVFFIYRCNF